VAKSLAFVRLPEGRLWHVEGARRLTACGRPVVSGDPGDGRVCEVLEGHVPSGAWVCPRCRDDLAAQLAAVDMAMAADPRRRKSPQKPLPWWLTPRSWSAESRCRDDLAAQLAAVDMAMAADPRRRRTPQKPLPWWLTPRSMSADAIWRELSAEYEGRPFTCEQYVSWLMREHLHPYGLFYAPRELVA